MHLIGYLYEDYHDARSLEHKLLSRSAQAVVDCSDLYSGYPVWPLTMMRFSWFSSAPSGEFRDLEMGHNPFIPYSHSSFINPNM
jgi:hypothetical protein